MGFDKLIVGRKGPWPMTIASLWPQDLCYQLISWYFETSRSFINHKSMFIGHSWFPKLCTLIADFIYTLHLKDTYCPGYTNLWIKLKTMYFQNHVLLTSTVMEGLLCVPHSSGWPSAHTLGRFSAQVTDLRSSMMARHLFILPIRVTHFGMTSLRVNHLKVAPSWWAPLGFPTCCDFPNWVT